jgi:flagellar P-ring protein FlgI
MTRRLWWIAVLLAIVGRLPAAETRIKDLARIAGLERLDLVGYGIVAGLAGTGDKDLTLTRQTVANLLEHFDITLNVSDIKSKNVAAVMVTAAANPFHSEGDRVDVTISSLGDSESLEGGTLLMTPLLDPNGELYALAQGPLTVGGFSAGRGGRGGETVRKNITTTATIPSAAVLRRGQSVEFTKDGVLRLLLRHPDFTTAHRMAKAINAAVGATAIARDAGVVAVYVPQGTNDIGQLSEFVSSLEQLSVVADAQAKVVVNERTGTIVMGSNVNIAESVVAHGNLTVVIKESLQPSQPANLLLGTGQTGAIRSLETPDTKTTVSEDETHVMVVPRTTTVQQLADALNVMGATPRDLISILQALRRLGALQMEVEVM